jgi:hypothetical protein
MGVRLFQLCKLTGGGIAVNYTKNIDGTIKDNSGNIVFFSFERFVNDICEGDNCFLCGALPNDTEFSEEHVIPKWVLRKCDLFKQAITLPNGVSLRYDKYTVLCCKECNSFLGSTIEEPVCRAFEGGLDSVNEFVSNGGFWIIFVWLSLVFFKTHLKDTYLRKHLDHRKGTETIASDYDWRLMHHVHCIARAVKTGANLNPNCFGTTLVLPAKESDNYQNIDYRDTCSANTVLLRVGEVAFLTVLDDSCASSHFFSNHLKKINAPLSPIQLREVLSHLTLFNSKLKYRPSYFTAVDSNNIKVSIFADLPNSMELESHTKEELGEILYANVSEFIEKIDTPDENFTAENIRRGMFNFLFNEDGKFIKNSLEPVEVH